MLQKNSNDLFGKPSVSSAHAYIEMLFFFQMKINFECEDVAYSKKSSNSEMGNETKLTVNSTSLK